MPTDSADIFRPVVILPTYNNARTLAEVLSGVAAQGLPMIVVNDGCTDSTPAVLERWPKENLDAEIAIIAHTRNLGKGAALQTGFVAAGGAGYTHALTIDTDGQHEPGDIPNLLALSRARPAALVLGYRDASSPCYPARSRLGRWISNTLIHLECGMRVRDSQSGMRGYPLSLVRSVRCRAGHFGFEAEIITRAGWIGRDVAETPIVTRYLPPGQRVTHFRPWLDSARGVIMHFGLLARALSPWTNQQYQPVEMAPVSNEPFATKLWRWLNPFHAWRQLRRGNMKHVELSTALALGVFIGNLPIYGVQSLVSLYLARRLHLQPLAVVSGSRISIPPFAPLIIGAGICVGHFILHGQLPAWPGNLRHMTGRVARSYLLDWTVGGAVVGLVLAVVTFGICQLLLSRVKPRPANPTSTDAVRNSPWTFDDEQAIRAGS